MQCWKLLLSSNKVGKLYQFFFWGLSNHHMQSLIDYYINSLRREIHKFVQSCKWYINIKIHVQICTSRINFWSVLFLEPHSHRRQLWVVAYQLFTPNAAQYSLEYNFSVRKCATRLQLGRLEVAASTIIKVVDRKRRSYPVFNWLPRFDFFWVFGMRICQRINYIRIFVSI